MRLTKEQETVCIVFGRRDQNGKVHCRDCPMRLDDQYAVCLRTVSKEEAFTYWDWNGSKYPAIDRTERREV